MFINCFIFSLIFLWKIDISAPIDLEVTPETVRQHMSMHSRLLPLKIQNHTFYTSPDMVTDTFEESNIFFDINQPAPSNIPYLGSMPRLPYKTFALGKTLEEVMNEALNEHGRPYEAMIWLGNVIESIGISVMHELTKTTDILVPIILNDDHEFLIYYTRVKEIIDFLTEIFMAYYLRVDPIHKIISVFESLLHLKKPAKCYQRSLKYFNIFRATYVNCTGLVSIPPPRSLIGNEKGPVNFYRKMNEFLDWMHCCKKLLEG